MRAHICILKSLVANHTVCFPSPRSLLFGKPELGEADAGFHPTSCSPLCSPASSDLGWSPFTPRCNQKVLCLRRLWEIPSFLPAWGPATLNRFNV